MAQTSQPLLRKAEAAVRLGVSERSVLNYAERGLLEAVRLNARTTRVTSESVERFIRQRTSR